MLADGTQLGRYRVEGLLGRGGMAAVYRASHAEHDRPVALKVLDAGLGTDEDLLARFRREGRLQASLRHPGIVPVYEAGESEHGSFIAMKLVDGPTLAALIEQGALDARRALALLTQAADALDAAHTAGLVHRDVKPQNVLVGPGDQVFLGDFGLGRGGAADSRSATGSVAGTVAYLAPEVIRGEPAGPAADRYAFAAMAFECLTGTRVFPRATDAAVLYAHTSEPPPAISRRRGELPATLDRLFAGALAKDPGERPESARRFVDAVAEALSGAGALDLGPPSPLALGPAGDATAAPLPRTAARDPPRRGPTIAAALVASAVTAAVVAVLADGADRTAPTDPVPGTLPGAVVLGSDLAKAGRPLDCRTGDAGASDCSVLQTRLPGRRLVVPSDGAIRRWSVRSGRGELSLQVLRPRGGGAFQISRSRNEFVQGDGVQTFTTDLAVERGDMVALHAVDGGAVGVRTGVRGAGTHRWFPRAGAQRPADLVEGTGFDHELLLRAELVPGAEQRTPEQVTAPQAASLPAGRLRARRVVRLGNGRQVTVALVRVGGGFVLDMVVGGRRTARIGVPDFVPEGGRLLKFEVGPNPGEDQTFGVYLEHVNFDSTRVHRHYYGGDPGQFTFIN